MSVLAIGMTEFGGPDVLRVLPAPDPTAAAGEVVLRVTAAAVNPTDTMLRSGALPRTAPLPFVPGMDAAGVIESVGAGVDGLYVGQRAMAIVVPEGLHGAYREAVALPAASVALIPADVDDAHAATVMMNALTARVALDRLGLAAGEWLAITGAAGVLGGYLIQQAKYDGLRVVADAAPRDELRVRGLGADAVVSRGDGFATAVRSLLGAGAAGAVDAAVLGAEALGAVRDNGALVALRGWRGGSERGIEVAPIFVSRFAQCSGAIQSVRRQLALGVLTPHVAEILPAAQAPRAHRMLEAGGLRGRCVLDFSA